MNAWLLITPVALPLALAITLFFTRHRMALSETIAVTGTTVLLLASALLMLMIVRDGVQVSFIGRWPAPFGISFVADILSAAMVLITGIIGIACVIYTMADIRHKPSYVLFHVFFQLLLAGVNGAFLTGDIFNLYVWFEVMIIASFGLMILDGSKTQIDGAVKYVVLNLVATLAFLLAVGLLYGATGTLNMADLSGKVALLDDKLIMMLSALFLFGFAVKAGLFPLFAWLPTSYHTLPSAVVALFAALLTKVGVYVLIRVFTLIFPLETSGWQPLMLWIAGLTMLIGVLGAACQSSIKRILSFHIISQIGYMIMGLALYTSIAIAGAVFYIIHHIIVKANLFLVGGYLQRLHGSDALAKLGGTHKATPWLGILFLIPAFSLAGFPPLSGFWGKFLVIKASLQVEHYVLAGTALFVGLLTIFSMTKIWAEAFWKAAPEGQITQTLSPMDKALYLAPIIFLALLTIIIGIAVEPLFRIAEHGAAQLLYPEAYVNAVLGGQP